MVTGRVRTVDAKGAEINLGDDVPVSYTHLDVYKRQLLDNSDLSVEESIDLVLNWWQGRQPF